MIMTIIGFLLTAVLAFFGFIFSALSGIENETGSVRDARLACFVGFAFICAAVGVGYALGAQ